jgi:hypothetical protein
MKYGAPIFVACYALLSAAVALYFRSYFAAGHDSADVPTMAMLLAGPMITLAVGHGLEVFILASLIVVPLGAAASCRKGLKLAMFGVPAAFIWIAFGWLLT